MDRKQIIEEFGRLFIEQVRDQTLWYLEKTISGELKSESGKKNHQIIDSMNLSSADKEKLDHIIVVAVDNCLHNFMFMFEENAEELKLCLKKDGEALFDLEEISDGLAGELYTEDGWIQKYSSYKKYSI